MKRMRGNLFGLILYVAAICHAASSTENQTKVTLQRATEISGLLGKNKVFVKIATHEIDIGRPSESWPPKKLTNCTYSRFPCSLVDYIDISINGQNLFVARSVYADLADIAVASLRQGEGDQMILTLLGGDASESYKVEVTIDKGMVQKRELKSNFDNQVMQKTIYFSSQTEIE